MSALALFPECRVRRPRYTKAFRLSPESLIQIAKKDIAAKRLNHRVLLVEPNFHAPKLARMGFDYRDIRHTDEPIDVLRRTLRPARRKPRYQQENRILLYGDIRALKAAIRILERL